MKILTDVVTDLLIDAVESCFKGEIDTKDISVQFTKDIKVGHLQTNIALVSSKKLRRNPRDIASTILENINSDEIIRQTNIAGPGFINFFIKSDYINYANLHKMEEKLNSIILNKQLRNRESSF